jgi:hypothetical protein
MAQMRFTVDGIAGTKPSNHPTLGIGIEMHISDKSKRLRLRSKAFSLRAVNDLGDVRLVLRDGTDMEDAAIAVNEIRDVLRDNDAHRLPKLEDTSVRFVNGSLVAFYGSLLLTFGLFSASSYFHVPIQIVRIMGISMLSLVSLSGLSLAGAAFYQVGSVLLRWFKRKSSTSTYREPERADLCCVEAIRRERFDEESLSFLHREARTDRISLLRFVGFLAGLLVFAVTPYASEALKDRTLIAHYWMLAPAAFFIPLVIYALAIGPIARLERWGNILSLSIPDAPRRVSTAPQKGRHDFTRRRGGYAAID